MGGIRRLLGIGSFLHEMSDLCTKFCQVGHNVVWITELRPYSSLSIEVLSELFHSG